MLENYSEEVEAKVNEKRNPPYHVMWWTNAFGITADIVAQHQAIHFRIFEVFHVLDAVVDEH